MRSGKLPFAFIALPGDVFGADTLGTDGIGPEGEDPGRFNPPPCETTDKSTGNGGLRYQIFSFFDNSSEKCIKSALLSITDREAKKETLMSFRKNRRPKEESTHMLSNPPNLRDVALQQYTLRNSHRPRCEIVDHSQWYSKKLENIKRRKNGRLTLLSLGN